MKKHLHLICIIIGILFLTSRCGKITVSNEPFNKDNLLTEKFEIDILKDTSIETTAGIIIKIPKGSLKCKSGNTAALQIKEALTLADMIKGGLTTRSDGDLLSSSGMFFIAPVNSDEVEIVHPLTAAVPASFYDAGAKIYKGNIDDKGALNWTAPQPVENQADLFEAGRQIFNTRCKSCHTISDKKNIGSGLAYISKRRDANWLFQFTKDPQRSIHGYDSVGDTLAIDYKSAFYSVYAQCLYKESNHVIMPPNYNLSNEDLHNLYNYIENESEKLHLPMPADNMFHCTDSCYKYLVSTALLEHKRKELIKDNGSRIDENRSTNQPPSGDTNINSIFEPIDRVTPEDYHAEYYKISITSFGWHNIDECLRDLPGVENSELIVTINGAFQKNLNVFIAIPSYKVFADGGRLSNKENEYGFYQKDGKLPLPQNVKTYVFAVGEDGDQLIFGSSEFNSSLTQTIAIEPAKTDMPSFNNMIKKIGATGLEIKAAASKNAKEIKTLDNARQEIEKLKPKNCDCNCVMPMAQSIGEADSVKMAFK